MRIRTIKPEFWASESMGRLSRDVRLVFIGLWSLADDHGRFRADPRFIAGQLFPYDDDGVAIVSRALASLRECSSIVLYEAGGSKYGAICHWRDHQKIDRPSRSRLPQPPETALANIREPSPQAREASCEEGKGSGKGKEQGEEGSAPPPPDVSRPAPVAAFHIDKPDIERIDEWTEKDFWLAAEHTRRDAGFPPEKWPAPLTLARFWGEARAVAEVRQLADAFVTFTQDDHWLRATPPAPFAAFAKQFTKYLPRRAAC